MLAFARTIENRNYERSDTVNAEPLCKAERVLGEGGGRGEGQVRGELPLPVHLRRVQGDDNQYKKYFSQCKENAEAWALKVHQSMTKVVSEIKQVQVLIDNLQTQGKDKIHKLCVEVMASSNPPIRKKNGWNVCSISGTRSDACLEIGRRGKETSLILVHQKFSPFIINLWFVCKLEHIIKHQTKNWILKQDTDEIYELCNRFQSSDDMIQKWYKIFCDAVRHVKLSIMIESSG